MKDKTKQFQKGDIIVNSDSYIGECLSNDGKNIEMKIRKGNKEKIERWDIDCIRKADDSDIKELQKLKEKLDDGNEKALCSRCKRELYWEEIEMLRRLSKEDLIQIIGGYKNGTIKS